jgi:protein-tyrosine phosphatase
MEMDQIAENLFVGSSPTGERDIESLVGKGITAVLTVQTDDDLNYWGINWEKRAEQYNELGIVVRRVPVPDFDPEALRQSLPECVAVLDDLLKQGHTVFLHCNAGMNRSPTIAIAYLHWIKHWKLEAAINHVMQRHFCDPYLEAIRGASLP